MFGLFKKRDEHAAGVAAAKELIAKGDRAEIMRNYGYSAAAPDQTKFDRGFRDTIKAWMHAA